MEYICPVCQGKMTMEENKIMFQDYICRRNLDTHMYIHRVRNDEIHQLKIRITEADGSKLCCKIMFDQNKSEVWTGSSNANENRVQINHALEVDLSDIEKMKQKIKTYMLFS